jgi:5'-nucleotidase
MRILVANDDGFYAEGLKYLVNEMKKLGEVVVIAPAEHQSGAGHSITFNKVVKVEKEMYDEETEGYKIYGTPKDCVELGLSAIVKDIDFVISGINEGGNLASDIPSSGTCGAACGALPFKVPAMAVSLGWADSFEYSAAAKVAYEVAKWFIKQPFNKEFVLNVNVPNIPEEQIKGYTVAGFGGYPQYHQDLTPTFDGKYYYYNTRSTSFTFHYTNHSLSGDLYALDNGYVTLTPINLNMVKETDLPLLEKAWNEK